METILYARDQGPQCINAEVIFQYDSGEDFVKQLQSCRLTWYWHSVREEGRQAVVGQPELPRCRPLTLLREQNWNDLALDIEEKIVGAQGDEENPGPDYFEHRNLWLFGLNGTLAAPLEVALDEAMRRFLQDLDPLEIVFFRIQDDWEEWVFFRHQTSPEVRCLFDAWELDPQRPSKVRTYDRLKKLQLESLSAGMKNWFR